MAVSCKSLMVGSPHSIGPGPALVLTEAWHFSMTLSAGAGLGPLCQSTEQQSSWWDPLPCDLGRVLLPRECCCVLTSWGSECAGLQPMGPAGKPPCLLLLKQIPFCLWLEASP